MQIVKKSVIEIKKMSSFWVWYNKPDLIFFRIKPFSQQIKNFRLDPVINDKSANFWNENLVNSTKNWILNFLQKIYL